MVEMLYTVHTVFPKECLLQTFFSGKCGRAESMSEASSLRERISSFREGRYSYPGSSVGLGRSFGDALVLLPELIWMVSLTIFKI